MTYNESKSIIYVKCLAILGYITEGDNRLDPEHLRPLLHSGLIQNESIQ